MRILITGSSGFIGFHLARFLLEKGKKVYGFDSINNYYDSSLKRSRTHILKKYKNFSFTKSKLENNKVLNKVFSNFRPKIVIHLAAQAGVRYSVEHPRVYLDSNIIGSFNIIELSHKFKIKHLIMASSSSVYGANETTPYKEIDKTDSQLSIYASTKKSNESLAHSYSNLWKVPITMLRFFTVYGPWGRPDMALFKFTNCIFKNKKIDVYNYGKMYRDFTYIDDVVKAIDLLINKAPNKNQKNKYKNDSLSKVAPFRILNLGNNKRINLIDFIKQIEIEIGKKAIKNYLPLQKGDVKQTLSNTKLLKQITNFIPEVNYKIGIKNFIRWYKNYYKES